MFERKAVNVIGLGIDRHLAWYRMQQAKRRPFTPRNAIKVFVAGFRFGRANALYRKATR